MIKNLESEAGKPANEIRIPDELRITLRANFSAGYASSNPSLASAISRTIDSLAKHRRYDAAAAICVHFNYPLTAIQDAELVKYIEHHKRHLSRDNSRHISMQLLC